MFSWLGKLLGNAVVNAFTGAGASVSNSIFDAMAKWLYNVIFNAIVDFCEKMGNMGADVFDLPWVEAIIELMTMFGWALFVAGIVVAVFDLAIEHQSGKASPQAFALNVLKGFFACSLLGTLPVELYKFCVTLQSTLSQDLTTLFIGQHFAAIPNRSNTILNNIFSLGLVNPEKLIFFLLCLIAFGYCIVSVFFQNIKRGGILIVQISVGALYMFSVPRGYTEGFVQWIKQVIAICLTAFMQTTLLYLGLMTFQDHMLLGLGVMLSANEVPRIAQQFGLDSSVKMNMMSAVYATSSIVNLTRTLTRR